jgi:hypothetical protein
MVCCLHSWLVAGSLCSSLPLAGPAATHSVDVCGLLLLLLGCVAGCNIVQTWRCVGQVTMLALHCGSILLLLLLLLLLGWGVRAML